MAKKESIVEKISTGIAEAHFIAVCKSITKYDPEGLYHANVLIPKTEGEKIAKMAKAIEEKQFETYRKNNKRVEFTACVPYVKVEKDENGRIIKETPDPEGRYILKTKNKAYIKNGVPGQKIPVFDSRLNPIEGAINIGAGSTVRLGLTLEGYSTNLGTGVSVKLRMLQIIDLVQFGGFKADDFFSETEGYEFNENDVETSVEEDEEADF